MMMASMMVLINEIGRCIVYLSTIAEITVQIIPPQNPAHVFLGEMSGNSFLLNFLPSVEPKTYPPMSELQIRMKKQSNMIPLNSLEDVAGFGKNTIRFESDSGTAI